MGWNNKSNTICLYNPITKSCDSSTACKLDEGYSPLTNFPSQIHFNGGLTIGFLCHKTDPITKPFPPLTWVNLLLNGQHHRGTTQHVPMPPSQLVKDYTIIHPDGSIEEDTSHQCYSDILDNDTTHDITYADLIHPTGTPYHDPTVSSSM